MEDPINRQSFAEMEENLCIKQEVIDEGYGDVQETLEHSPSSRIQYNLAGQDKLLQAKNLVCQEEDEDGIKYAIYIQNHIDVDNRFTEMNSDQVIEARQQWETTQNTTDITHEENGVPKSPDHKKPNILYIAPLPVNNDQLNQNFGDTGKYLSERIPIFEAQQNQNIAEIGKSTFEKPGHTGTCYSSTEDNLKPSRLQNKQHECDICGQVYMRYNNLQMHRLTHKISQNLQEADESASENNGQTVNSSTGEMWITSHEQNKRRECNFCGKFYMRENTFQMHLLTHNLPNPQEANSLLILPQIQKPPSKEKKFTLFCEVCNKGFLYKSDLNRHRATHENIRPYECEKCGSTYKQLKNLREHLAYKHGDERYVNPTTKKYRCSQCPMTFYGESKLRVHLLVHTDEKPYVCNKCGRHYKYMHSLTEHLQTHATENPKKCQYCCLMFESRNRLKVHWAESSGDGIHEITIKSHPCDVCDKVFHSRYGLNRHMLSHSDERKFQCTVCGLRFKQAAHLKGHAATHEKVKPKKHALRKLNPLIPCDLCPFVFKTKTELKTHRLQFANDGLHSQYAKPDKIRFQCETCDKVFDSRYGLKRHNLSHSDERAFKCSVCEMRFKQAAHLNGHMQTHRKLDSEKRKKKYAARKHICSICGEGFDYLTHLTRHVTNHKKQEKNSKKEKCQVCHLEFSKRSDLKVHLIESIGDGVHKTLNSYMTKGLHKCAYCNKTFHNKGGMKLHILRSHTRKKQTEKNAISEVSSTSISGNETSQFSREGANEKDMEKDQIALFSQDIHEEEDKNEFDTLVDLGKQISEDNKIQNVSLKSNSHIENFDSIGKGKLDENFAMLKSYNGEASGKSIPADQIVHTDDGVRYKCLVCFKLWKTVPRMRQHIKTHEKNIQCEKCNKLFYMKEQLEDHIDNQYQCSLCPERFCKAVIFKKHNRQHRKEKIIHCEYCQKTFLSKIRFDIHVSSHTGEKPFQCTICGDKFKQQFGFRMHLRRHQNDKRYLCHVCGKKFIDSTNLKHHSRVHFPTILKCDKCGKQYKYREALFYHKKHNHSDFSLKCKFCDKTFHHRATLKIHELRHTGERPFSCDMCDKRFYTKALVQLHSVVHTKEKPYECNICRKKFCQRAALGRHKKTMHKATDIK